MTPRLTALASALALAGLLPVQPALAADRPAARPGAPALTDPAPAVRPATQTLIAQARSWQDRGRSDLAAAAWRKLLAGEPQNADALYGLALAQINLGQTEAAADSVAALQRLRPDHPGLRKLETQLRVGGSDAASLQEARRLAAAGQFEAAARQYELMLAGPQPVGDVAIEYYQTLAGTPHGWDDASRGLERLAKADPNDGRARLAHAKVLSYREPRRREAIRLLAELSQPSAAGAPATPAGLSVEQRQEAREAWRQALLWLGAKAGDHVLYRDYLAQGGEDSAVRARLAELSQGTDEARRAAEARERDPLTRGRRQGFDALASGDLTAAGERFARLLRERPQDPDALGGLGVVRLREGRVAEARDLLGRAVAVSGNASSPWRGAHVSAQVRLLLQQADAARSAQRLPQALELARQAAQLDPRDPLPVLALGDLQADAGQWLQAEGHYREALQLDPQQVDAHKGWLRAMHATGRGDAARQAIEALPEERATALGGRGVLQARLLQLDAETARLRGDLPRAQALLTEAQRLNPDDPWLRLNLAQQHLAGGREAEGLWLMDELAAQPPRQAAGWWALAQWHADRQDPQAGLQALDRVAMAERRPEMGRLHRRLRVQQQIGLADTARTQGRTVAALAALSQAQIEAEREPELLARVAVAYGEAGQGARGLQLLRGVMAQERGRDVPTRLQYAQLLDTVRQDGELGNVLVLLAGQNLSGPQREQHDALRVNFGLRQVDRLREAGDSAGAYEQLLPLLQERPSDSRLALALARLHVAVGEPAQGLQVVDAVLQAEPDNLEAWLAGATTATAAGESDYALAALQQAEQRAPGHPRVLAEYARYHRARGELRRAADYLRAAIAAQRPAPSRGLLPAGNGRSTRSPATEGGTDWGRPLPPATVPRAPSPGLTPRPAASAGTESVATEGRLAWPVDARAPGPASAPTAPPALQASTEAWLRGASADASGAVGGVGAAPIPGAGLSPGSALSSLSWPHPASNPLPTTSALARLPAERGLVEPAVAPGMPQETGAVPLAAALHAQFTPAPGSPWSRPVEPVPSEGDAVTRPARPRGLQDELAELIAERGTRQLEGGAALRWRSGDSGTSQLVEVRTPVEFQTPIGDFGRLHVRVVPTLLEAGQPPVDADGAARFGSQALGGAASGESVAAAGVGLSVGLDTRRLSGDIGLTPLGFDVVNVVGGLRLVDGGTSPLGYSAEVSRRAITDSVLSYAGVRDVRTNQVWGGVTATGLRGSLSWRADELRLYGYAGTHVLQGQGVMDNMRFELGAGTTWRGVDEPGRRVDVGLQLGYAQYRRNLRHFTLGHGGYFSPQQNVTLASPVSMLGQQGALRWSFAVSPGLSAWREDRAPYFPLDAAAQAQLTSRVVAGLSTQAAYPGRSSIGLTLALQGAAEYRLSPRLVLGSRVALDNASQYTQMSGGLYLRLNFEPDVGGQLLLQPGPLHD